MKIINRTFVFYLLLVILPSTICSLFYINFKQEKDYEIRKDHAKWIASIHETHWDQLVSETVTTLKMLSLASESTIQKPEQMKPLLVRTQQSDPRFGSILMLDSKGRIITGSDPALITNKQATKSYIRDCVQSKDIIISNEEESLPNGQKVIGIANPVTDKKNQLQYIFIAQLRVDYVLNVMRVLTPDSKLVITNPNDRIMMKFNVKDGILHHNKNWLTVPIDRLPWNINIKIAEQNSKKFFLGSIIAISTILILFNILFLLGKYFLLRRQAEKEKKQNEIHKLELVGTLAASTAHEIRNPLTGIKGLVQLLNEKYNSPDDQFYFTIIQNEIDRINQIVSEFLILGKPTVQKLENIDIREIIGELTPLISSEANLYHISWTCHMPETPLQVKCSRDQMKQVLLNITKNAFESMKNGGKLTIHLAAAKNLCKISIIDTGVGIPKEELDKIFLPFYTSKESGTGLGLVVCKRILHEFGGDIFLYSKVNEGTKIEIILPLVNWIEFSEDIRL